jgi:hypothetical protein
MTGLEKSKIGNLSLDIGNSTILSATKERIVKYLKIGPPQIISIRLALELF